jgi:hypothetical protein
MKLKQNEQEAKTSKRKLQSKNFEAKKDKVKFWEICKESKKNIKAGLLLFHVYT